jgi:predicted RecA/RadA family phage recombinase
MKKLLVVLCAGASLAFAAIGAPVEAKQLEPALEVVKMQVPEVGYQVKAAPSHALLEALKARGDDAAGMISLLLGAGMFAGMINYIQPGNAITAAAPYQRNAGQGALLGGSLFGVAVDTVASGATGVFWTEGVYELTKLSGASESFTLGTRIFWDNTNKRLTVVSTSNVCVGVVTEAAATDAVVARIKLQPTTPAGT